MLRRRQTLWAAGAALAAGPALVRAAEVLKVTYPAPESRHDQRSDDMIALLRAALEVTEARHGPFELKPSALYLTQARQIIELEQGGVINVHWSATTREKEQRLLPLRFPTRRGLLGYRIALIRRERQPLFQPVHSLEQLRAFSFGQGATWVDTQVLRAQGLRVEVGAYENLFRMLDMGRFDLFPRTITEVFGELATRQNEFPDLAVERSLALHYPMPFYFFFNRRDVALAARVHEGLQTMLKDGSFEQHFWRFHGEAVRRARIHERQVIELPNPFLPAETPPPSASVWLDLRKPPPGA